MEKYIYHHDNIVDRVDIYKLQEDLKNNEEVKK
jgi:hypothetical protein